LMPIGDCARWFRSEAWTEWSPLTGPCLLRRVGELCILHRCCATTEKKITSQDIKRGGKEKIDIGKGKGREEEEDKGGDKGEKDGRDRQGWRIS